ncbi:MAG: TraB/GumN family protein [Sphingorhabdus sp.]
MSKRIKSLFLYASLALLAYPAAARAHQAPTEAPPELEALDPVKVGQVQLRDVDPALWVVKDEDSTIFLFGTVHILKPGLGWFDEAVKQAFDSSDRLVLEIVEPSPADSQSIFTRLAIDSSGKTLRAKMSDDDRTVYEAAMGKIGLPVAALDPLDPWAAAITLSVLAMQQKGFDVNSGVEKQLSAAAKAAGKPIGGVETMEYQLAIFEGLPEAVQIKFLTETARNIESAGEVMDKMVDLWAKPDPEELGKLMNEGLTSAELYDALLTKRNANWAKWVDAQMKKPGTTFLAVGAGHLSGPTSVPALLAAYGLTAQRVAY